MMQTIPFHKMQGLGNDFVVINAVDKSIEFSKPQIQRLAHRYLGIGFDQLLLVRASQQADFACQIFNSNGSEAEQCGNGLRCVARFIQDIGLSKKKSLTIETKAGVFSIMIGEDNLIEVTMSVPEFLPGRVPFIVAEAKKSDIAETVYDLQLASETLAFTVLSMGNPHAILRVSSVADYPVSEIGQQVAMHTAFPQSVNVGFMEIIDPRTIRLRTFERGVGETFACGSNSCAAVVAGILNHSLANKVKVKLTFGDLSIEWAGGASPVKMIGPAEMVYEGVFSSAMFHSTISV